MAVAATVWVLGTAVMIVAHSAGHDDVMRGVELPVMLLFYTTGLLVIDKRKQRRGEYGKGAPDPPPLE